MAQQPSTHLTLIRILRNSSIKKRAKKRHTQRKILLAIFVTITLLLLASLVFGVCSIADAIASRPPKQTETGGLTPAPLPQVVVYEKVPYSNTAIHVGELLLVNRDHAYDFDANKDLSTKLKTILNNRVLYNDVANTFMVNGNDKTWKLHETTLTALNDMMYKYYEIYADGSTSVSSAYRTFEDQDALKSSVAPGFSDHHTGYCVALKKSGNQSLEDDHWVYDQGYKYGFIQRYPNEKSTVTGVSDYEHCFRYVGIAHATYMTQNNLCMEEYISRLQTDFAGENHLAITGADGKQYEVYYVAASTTGELTTLSLPKNFAYTVSGDNVGGFIVTVDLSTPIV